MKVTCRDCRKLKRALKELSAAVTTCLRALDAEMVNPPGAERGRRIGRICTALEMSNDAARYFSLGVDWRTDKKREAIQR